MAVTERLAEIRERMAEACRQGCRLARGGEFTLRAFLAGRLDLVQAEAVLGVVDAATPAALAAALTAGGVSARGEGGAQVDFTATYSLASDFPAVSFPSWVPPANFSAAVGSAGAPPPMAASWALSL